MTRKHFNALAAAIRRITDAHARRVAAEAVAEICHQFNPRFDRERFFRACGV